MQKPPIIYRIDADDRIVSVNEAWTSFADGNGGASLRPDAVVGRRIWDFVENDTVCELYARVVESARAGRTVRFQYRCDAPGVRRDFEMHVAATTPEVVEFTSHLRSEKPYPNTPLRLIALEPGDLIRMCGWCHAIATNDGTWLPVDRAMDELHLMESSGHARISHGMCPTCQQTAFNLLT